MITLVVYDIPDDRVRARTADVLLGFGQRAQESVFECRLDAKALAELVGRLRETIAPDPGAGVRIYRVCESCYEASSSLGQQRDIHHSAPFIVI